VSLIGNNMDTNNNNNNIIIIIIIIITIVQSVNHTHAPSASGSWVYNDNRTVKVILQSTKDRVLDHSSLAG